MKGKFLYALVMLSVVGASLTGCASVSVPTAKLTKDDYGCLVPPPSILASVGFETSVSGNVLGHILPNISVKVDPKVIETGSKALRYAEMTEYLTCRLVNQYNISSDFILPLQQFYLFYGTNPTSEQYLKYVNDNPLVKQVVTAVNENKPLSGPVNGKRIYVDAVKNGSSNRDGWRNGSKLTLEPGNWAVMPVGGGWSAWSGNVPPDVKGGWTWFMYVTMDQDTRTLGKYDWAYKNKKEASVAAKNIGSLDFSLEKPTDVYFWIWEDGNIRDNQGVLVVDVLRK